MDEANDRHKHSEDGAEKMNGPSCGGSKGGGRGLEGEEASCKKQRIGNDVKGRVQVDEPRTSLGLVRSAEAKKHKVMDAHVDSSKERENPASRCEALPDGKNVISSGSENQDSSLKNSKDQNISKHPSQDLSIIVYNTPLNPQIISSRTPASLENEKFSSYRFDPSASAERQPTSSLDADFSVTWKSKRVMWRSEEVEMLKKGVQEFSRENRIIPWRKILEYGHEAFDVNRTPSDLKEKWKKVSSKLPISEPQYPDLMSHNNALPVFSLSIIECQVCHATFGTRMKHIQTLTLFSDVSFECVYRGWPFSSINFMYASASLQCPRRCGAR